MELVSCLLFSRFTALDRGFPWLLLEIPHQV